MEKQRKTIQVNPDFFKIGKKTKRKKERLHSNLRETIKPNNLKKQLLAKIKTHQQQQYEKNNDNKADVEQFQNDFNSSLNYLQTMIKQKKQKKHKRTRKKKVVETPQFPSNPAPQFPSNPAPQFPSNPAPIINTQPFNKDNNSSTIQPQLVNSAPIKHSEPPPYGCLKNGTKPTYSQYMKTMKKKRTVTPLTITLPPKPPPTKEILERQDKLNKLREHMATPKKEPIINIINKKRTIKIFKLGKKDGKVGVLIKSGKTRKKIKEEHKIIHSKCIADVKHYLRKHNLIKAGTSAPDNVLRKLYEDCFLSGDIYNRNVEMLLHNYMQED